MATVNYDQPTRTLTITMNLAEDRVFRRVVRTAGVVAFKEGMEAWLRKRLQDFRERDEKVIKAKLPNASEAEREAAIAALGLTPE